MAALTRQDRVVIRIALEELIANYERLIGESASAYKGAFRTAKAITEEVLENFNRVQA